MGVMRQILRKRLPLAGHEGPRNVIACIEGLEDEDLVKLNRLLSWHTFVLDSKGRRFGDIAWAGKRDTAQVIPDPRISLLDEIFDLNHKHVLEIGCFEGIHTIALAQRAQRVTALDARIENVVKTIVRLGLFGEHAQVLPWNVEERSIQSFEEVDVVHHVGVLYHLTDPVAQISDVAKTARLGIMLDTHYCLPSEVDDVYTSAGESFSFKRYEEGRRRGVFSGMSSFARWLLLDDIERLVTGAGFKIVEKRTRLERNGPRVLLIARAE